MKRGYRDGLKHQKGRNKGHYTATMHKATWHHLCGGASRLGLHGHWVAAQVMWTKALPTLLLYYPLSPYFPSLCFFTITQHTHTHACAPRVNYSQSVGATTRMIIINDSVAGHRSVGGSCEKANPIDACPQHYLCHECPHRCIIIIIIK